MGTPPHPGVELSVMLAGSNKAMTKITLVDFQKKTNINQAQMSRIIRGHLKVSPRVALALEKCDLGIAEEWLVKQNKYDLHQLREKDFMQ